uniref:H(+)/Pi cotransporter n=1 Tax=Leersia perrieri TaxID=77586 RepID=A0A0D9W9Y3_9ORYZ
MSTTEALLAGGGGGEKRRRRVSIDEALAWHAGEFGRWQLRHFVLVSSAWLLEALHTMVIIFADREPAMVCAAPDGRCGDRCGGGGGGGGGWEWVGGPASSTVAEFGLVCGERYKVGLVQAIFFAGCMIGAGVFGHLSDSFLGRKGSLQVVCLLNGVFGILTALSPNYWAYAALRLLTGFSAGSVGLCSFVLATEPVGPSRRGAAGMSTFYFFSAGIAALAGVAAALSHSSSWRALYVVTSLPSLAFVATVLPFVSESPRWFLVRRRADDALRVVRDIAAGNGRCVPDDFTLKLDDEGEEDHKDVVDSSATATGSIVDVFRSRTTRFRLVLSVVINLLASVVYYGLSLNVVNLKTNLYVSVVVNSLAEMPAYLLTALLLDRFGRKPLAIGTMLLSGVFCSAGSLIPGAGPMRVARLACGVVGIFGMAATYNLLFIYTAELFPTAVRNAALGCTSQASQMGAILAPLVVVLGERVPFALFGVSGLIGGFLVFCLPETKNKPMYDTMAGLEEGEKSLLK